MNEERIKEVFSDKAFVEELISTHEPEKIQALLESKDIEMSIAEIEKFKDAVMKKMENPDAALELSDEDLEDVAGGCLWIAIPIAIGILAGICVADNLTGGRW
jgi:lactobin A/cerein 7B family class IIb bacteriocin